jgi:hypothetical protein
VCVGVLHPSDRCSVGGVLGAAHNIPSAVCLARPEDEQVMLETCRGI